MADPKERFSTRAENYARYRPGYPREVLDLLRAECGFSRSSVVADVASGTGLLSELFLRNGNRVYGVEPNDEMREAGERYLAGYPLFASVRGTAEETTLDEGSVDVVVVGHAFHWFDVPGARTEFARVLRPGGSVVLLWNELRHGASAFVDAYERLIRRHKTQEYEDFDREGGIRALFAPEPFGERALHHSQRFDLAGLRGRLLSSSYVPDAGQPGYEALMRELKDVFRAHARGGEVAFEYETLVYYGRLGRAPGARFMA